MYVRGNLYFSVRLRSSTQSSRQYHSITVKKRGQRDVLRELETRMRKVETFIALF